MFKKYLVIAILVTSLTGTQFFALSSLAAESENRSMASNKETKSISISNTQNKPDTSPAKLTIADIVGTYLNPIPFFQDPKDFNGEFAIMINDDGRVFLFEDVGLGGTRYCTGQATINNKVLKIEGEGTCHSIGYLSEDLSIEINLTGFTEFDEFDVTLIDHEAGSSRVLTFMKKDSVTMTDIVGVYKVTPIANIPYEYTLVINNDGSFSLTEKSSQRIQKCSGQTKMEVYLKPFFYNRWEVSKRLRKNLNLTFEINCENMLFSSLEGLSEVIISLAQITVTSQ